MPADASSLRSYSWLRVHDMGDEAVLITARGNAEARRAYDLWAACEHALETSGGRPVICDVTGVCTFDADTLRALRCAAKAARRLHLDFSAVMIPGAEMEQFAHLVGLERVLPIFPSVARAVSTTAVLDPSPGSRS
jgi:anti-anti-sigma regulatory factor